MSVRGGANVQRVKGETAVGVVCRTWVVHWGGLLFSGTPAYAADVTISSGDTSYQYRGINGKTITHSGTGNRITVGEAGKGNLPNISNGDVSGAGDAYELGDITDNTLIIRSIRVNGSVYGGRSRQGKITGNTVEFSGGTVVQSIYGGYTDNSSNANTLTGNRIDFSGGTVNSQLFGAATRGSGALTDNHVVVRGGIVEGTQFSAGAFSQGSGQVSGNTATLSSGSVKNLVGGVSQGTGHVAGNTLTISGGTAGILVGGYSSNAGNATGNTVTVIGGTVTGQIIGGNAAGAGAATGNTVNLGDGTSGTFKSGTNLTAADILGGNKTDVTGNTLNVYVKDASVKSVANFENYNFKLNNATTFGDTMLTVANAGDFTGTGVDLNKITVDSTGLSADYLRTQHGIKRMTLLKRSNDTDTLTFRNYAAREAATATETHEFRFVTNNGTGTANALMLEASRFKGSHVTYDGTTPTFGGEVYGGLSRFGHTTTGNTLTVTGKPTSGTPLSYAYGGKNEGATGDVKDNTATLELPANTSAIKDIYGGKITNAANAGEVSGNIVNMKRGTVEYAVGGQTDGTGAAKNNTVNLTGGTVTREIYGGLSYKGAATGNTVTISGGTVGSYTPADVYGGKKAPAAGSSASNNTVNLGAEDGTYTADLTKADIHGDNSTDGAVNNNTLNVRGKNITVNSVDNFDKYKFTLNNNIKDGDTMLTLKNDGFGREIDFANNFGLDTSKLTGKPTGLITLVKSATGTLKFKSGYVSRDLGSTDNVEYFVGTDTGEREGSSVIMGYNIFKGNAWTYNGTNPPNAKELFGGVSYNNHTTEGNTLTITNTSAQVGYAYGGKTAGRTGGAKGIV